MQPTVYGKITINILLRRHGIFARGPLVYSVRGFFSADNKTILLSGGRTHYLIDPPMDRKQSPCFELPKSLILDFPSAPPSLFPMVTISKAYLGHVVVFLS